MEVNLDDSEEPTVASGETSGTELDGLDEQSNISASSQNTKTSFTRRAEFLQRNQHKPKIQRREHRKVTRRVEKYVAHLIEYQTSEPSKNVETRFTRQQRILHTATQFNLDDSKEPAVASGETSGTELDELDVQSNMSASSQNTKTSFTRRAELLQRNQHKQKIQRREHRKLTRRVEKFAVKQRRKRRVHEFAARLTVSQPSQPTVYCFPVNIRRREQRLERALLLKRNKREQKIKRTQHRKLNRRVLKLADRLTICERVPLFFGDSGQSKSVDQIAKGLIGNFLISRENAFVLRILETEAYLEREPLDLAKFNRTTLSFKIPAGTLMLWPSAGFLEQPQLVIATGDYNYPRDVVLIRACEIIRGLVEIRNRLRVSRPMKSCRRPNLLLGPDKVAKALHKELSGNCNILDATKGIILLQEESPGKIILQGKRVLPIDIYNTTPSELSELPGAEKEYRFALSSRRMKYQEKSHLHPCKRQDLADLST